METALGFELNSATTSEAAFLFELQLSKLDQAGRQAVHAALDGDLSGFGSSQEKLPVGVSLVRSTFTETQKEKHSLKFNLLGIYNFMRVSTLILKGRLMIEPVTGELIITDTATATNIEASTNNFAADGEKLRKVLAESVMLTVAYQSSKLVTHLAQLKVAHTYFELHTKTDRTALKNNLDVFEALGFMTKDEKARILGIAKQFGKTTLYAETGYTDEVADDLSSRTGRRVLRKNTSAPAVMRWPGWSNLEKNRTHAGCLPPMTTCGKK